MVAQVLWIQVSGGTEKPLQQRSLLQSSHCSIGCSSNCEGLEGSRSVARLRPPQRRSVWEKYREGSMMEEGINSRVEEAENVTVEDLLQLGVEDPRRTTPAFEARAVTASKLADQAVAEAVDAIAVAAAAQGRLQSLQAPDTP